MVTCSFIFTLLLEIRYGSKAGFRRVMVRWLGLVSESSCLLWWTDGWQRSEVCRRLYGESSTCVLVFIPYPSFIHSRDCQIIRAEIAYTNSRNTKSNSQIQDSQSQSSLPRHSKLPTVVGVITLRTIPPFIPAHDIARGILHAGQAALTFGFMWTAM